MLRTALTKLKNACASEGIEAGVGVGVVVVGVVGDDGFGGGAVGPGATVEGMSSGLAD